MKQLNGVKPAEITAAGPEDISGHLEDVEDNGPKVTPIYIFLATYS